MRFQCNMHSNVQKLLLLMLSYQIVYSNNTCETPNAEIGTCVDVLECPIFLRTNNFTEEQRFFLRLSYKNCKNPASNKYIICCGTFNKFVSDADRIKVQIQSEPVNPTKNHQQYDECGEPDFDNKIVGGNYSGINEFPWMALLKYQDKRYDDIKYSYSCGGSLINNRFVLTAAHCIVGDIEHSLMLDSVVLGEWNYSSPIDCDVSKLCNDPITIGIEKTIVHEAFLIDNTLNQQNDIALIKLQKVVTYTDFIKPICLPEKDDLRKNEQLFIAGWGIYNITSRLYSDTLLKASVEVTNSASCKSSYRKKNTMVSITQICAVGKGNIDSCSGDSGGPLMQRIGIKFNLVGIVSFGPIQCGTNDFPSIYTKVFKYKAWIQNNMQF